MKIDSYKEYYKNMNQYDFSQIQETVEKYYNICASHGSGQDLFFAVMVDAYQLGIERGTSE